MLRHQSLDARIDRRVIGNRAARDPERSERVGEILRLADVLLADVAKGVYECTRYEEPEGRF